jgi:hypothetical protein
MARFADRAELETVLGGFFDKLRFTPQAHLIHQVGGVVDFIFRRPEGRLRWVPTPDGETPFIVDHGEGASPTLLLFEQDGDTAHRFWLGHLNLQDALARQLVRARGPLSRAMKLIPNLDDIYPLYAEHLKEIGRADWIE